MIMRMNKQCQRFKYKYIRNYSISLRLNYSSSNNNNNSNSSNDNSDNNVDKKKFTNDKIFGVDRRDGRNRGISLLLFLS